MFVLEPDTFVEQNNNVLLEIIGIKRFAVAKILSGCDARQFVKIVDHVRLIIISAAVGQFGKAFGGILLMRENSVLKTDNFQKLFWR